MTSPASFFPSYLCSFLFSFLNRHISKCQWVIVGPNQIGFRRPNSSRVWSLQLPLPGGPQEAGQWGTVPQELKWAFIVLTRTPSPFNLYLQTWTKWLRASKESTLSPSSLSPLPRSPEGTERTRRQRLSEEGNKRRAYLKSEWPTLSGRSVASLLFFPPSSKNPEREAQPKWSPPFQASHVEFRFQASLPPEGPRLARYPLWGAEYPGMAHILAKPFRLACLMLTESCHHSSKVKIISTCRVEP